MTPERYIIRIINSYWQKHNRVPNMNIVLGLFSNRIKLNPILNQTILTLKKLESFDQVDTTDFKISQKGLLVHNNDLVLAGATRSNGDLYLIMNDEILHFYKDVSTLSYSKDDEIISLSRNLKMNFSEDYLKNMSYSLMFDDLTDISTIEFLEKISNIDENLLKDDESDKPSEPTINLEYVVDRHQETAAAINRLLDGLSEEFKGMDIDINPYLESLNEDDQKAVIRDLNFLSKLI